MSGAKILVMVPSRGLISSKCAATATVASTKGALWTIRNLGKDSSWDVGYVHRAHLPEMRTQALKHAIDENYDALWFLDDDMTIPPDAFQRLWKHDVDVVAALAFKKLPPFDACAVRFPPEAPSLIAQGLECQMTSIDPDDAPRGLRQVDGVGMACTLIRRDVMKDVYEFSAELPFVHSNKVSEDIYFCCKAKQRGYKIHVDTSLVCGHVGEVEVTEEQHQGWKRLQEQKKRAAG